MNKQSVGDPTERALREVLAEQRPTGGAPAELRDRVMRIPAEGRPGGRLEPLRASASVAGHLAILAAAAVLAVAVLATLASRPTGQGPGVSPSVPAQHFDPSIDGLGIVSTVETTLTALPWLVAVAAGLILGGIALRSGRQGRVVALASWIVLVAGALWVSSIRGFEFGSAGGGVQGFDVQASAPRGSNGPGVLYITAEPGGHFVLAFQVHNPGPLPIRLNGIVEDAIPDLLAPRWTALWLYTDDPGGVPAPDAASAFHPIEVPPNGYVALYAVGRASRCAFGPTFTLPDLDTVNLRSRGNPRLAYSVIGLSGATEIVLPVVVAEPAQPNCPSG
ncbi:MAG: hypothetical protein M3R57_10555 [Chloroflexota bacterium]|nr:hypothetical protein [Chloroflexota bacterium]